MITSNVAEMPVPQTSPAADEMRTVRTKFPFRSYRSVVVSGRTTPVVPETEYRASATAESPRVGWVTRYEVVPGTIVKVPVAVEAAVPRFCIRLSVKWV